MKLLPFSTFSLVAILMVAAPSSAQMQTPPKPQTASPTAPAQTTTVPSQSKPAASVPFPQDAKYAIVDVQAVASNSILGKEAAKKLNDLRAKKAADLQDKNKQLQALQTKRDTSAPVLNDTARAQLDKEIDKLQRDIQYGSSSAQADLTDLNNELMGNFTKQVAPVVEEIAKEKGIYIVFTADSGVAYVAPAVNISNEVVRRLDAKKN